MILTIDVGNSHTVFGCFNKSALIATGRARTQLNAKAAFDQFLSINQLAPQQITHALLASVVPRKNEEFKVLFERIPFHQISHLSPFSFSIRTLSPETIGIDRLVNAEASLQITTSGCILIDAGTATTVCAMNEKKEFLGGAILPGLKTSLKALLTQTAQLPNIPLERPPHAIGRNTVQALQSGILLGHADAITGLLHRFHAEMALPSYPTIVATGGLFPLIKPLLKSSVVFDPHLTLKGIYAVYESLYEKH